MERNGFAKGLLKRLSLNGLPSIPCPLAVAPPGRPAIWKESRPCCSLLGPLSS